MAGICHQKSRRLKCDHPANDNTAFSEACERASVACRWSVARARGFGPYGKTTMNSTDSADHPAVIAWPPLIFLGCAAAGSLLHFIVPIRVMRYSVSLSLG